VRDYIHVVDLAEGHLAALRALERIEGAVPVNLGTGNGYSVLDVVRAASVAVGRDIPYEIGPRRPGDVAAVWADPASARALLGWTATRSLDDMLADHWRWQQSNPEGFGSATLAG
jgi:UDP-glucose 4-epimerase